MQRQLMRVSWRFRQPSSNDCQGLTASSQDRIQERKSEINLYPVTTGKILERPFAGWLGISFALDPHENLEGMRND